MERFEREARLLASLNNSHIGAIYGFEDAGNMPALVLELVEGDTLEDRVRRGPLPFSEALTIALQIADALEAAHRAGIIHRDLKPSNIKITPGGVVKVLDFGLAKALATEGSPTDMSKSPTITAEGTMGAAILGTAAYMSPEQARGQAVDAHRHLGFRVRPLRDANELFRFPTRRWTRLPNRFQCERRDGGLVWACLRCRSGLHQP